MAPNHSYHGASFLKHLADPDFASELQLPTKFVERCKEILQPKMELKKDGKSWKVETKLAGNHCFFTKGWRTFSEKVGLKHQETVVFTLAAAESAFNVSVYDSTGWQELPPPGECRNAEQLLHETSRRFVRKVAGSHFGGRMDIPRKFAVAAGIAGKGKVSLRDAKGRMWPVKVRDKGAKRFGMCGGFNKFLVANNVSIGSIISFEFIPGTDNTVEARIVSVPE